MLLSYNSSYIHAEIKLGEVIHKTTKAEKGKIYPLVTMLFIWGLFQFIFLYLVSELLKF